MESLRKVLDEKYKKDLEDKEKQNKILLVM